MTESEPTTVMNDFLILDPAQNSNQDNYKLLIGSIVPRPIAFVSTVSASGVPNLAPFSFFTGVCSTPPTVLFCPMVRGSDGEKKDTLRNIEETEEFVINIVSESIAAPMNQSAAEFPPEVNEFAEVGLTPVPSEVIRPPRVLESPLGMECRLQRIVPAGEGGVGSGFVVMGTVVRFHVRRDLYQEGRILLDRLKPVARLGGAAYCPVREVFEMPRP